MFLGQVGDVGLRHEVDEIAADADLAEHAQRDPDAAEDQVAMVP